MELRHLVVAEGPMEVDPRPFQCSLLCQTLLIFLIVDMMCFPITLKTF